MRKAAFGLAILSLLLLGAVLAVPPLVNWDSYRNDLAGALGDRLGGRLTIAGTLRFALLPEPTLTARDVELASPTGDPLPYMLQARSVEVKPAIWPLLLGRVELRKATLVDAAVDLQGLSDRLAAGGAAADAVLDRLAGSLAAGAPGSGEAARGRLSIGQLAVQDASITYRSGAHIERLEHIDAAADVAEGDAPLRVHGEMVARGTWLSFEAEIGPTGDAGVPLRLTLRANPATRLDIDATLSGRGSGRRLAGPVKLEGGDPAALAAMLGYGTVPPLLNRHFIVAGDLDCGVDGIALEQMAVDLGDLHAAGAIRFAFGEPPALDLRLALTHLDLDRWLADAGGAAAAATPAAAGSGGATAAIPPLMAGAGAAGLALPRDLHASLDLTADDLLWRGGILRRVQAQLALDRGVVTVERLSTLLPGGAEAGLQGMVATPPDGPHVSGTVEANADNLRELLGWLGVATDGVPLDRLRRASLSARFEATPDRIIVSGFDGVLDASHAQGAMTVSLRSGAAFGARLAIDQLNLDAYLPQAAGPPGSAATASAGVRQPAPDALALSLLAGVNLDLDASIGMLAWHGQPIRGVHATVSLDRGDFTIRELGIDDLGGASGKLAAIIEGVASGHPKWQAAFDLSGPELGRILRVALPAGFSPALAEREPLGSFSLGGDMRGEGGTLTLDADLDALGGHLHLAGDAGPAAGAADLAIALSAAKAGRMLAAALPSYRPAGNLGAAKLTARLVGKGGRLGLDGLSLQLGPVAVTGSLGMRLDGPRPRLDAALEFGDLALDPFLPVRQTAALDPSSPLRPGIILAQLATSPPRGTALQPWSRRPLDLSWLGLVDAEARLAAHSVAFGPWRIEAPQLTFGLDDGRLKLGRLSGQILGGSLTAEGVLDARSRPSIQGTLALAGAPLKRMLSAVAGTAAVDAAIDLDATIAAQGDSTLDLVSSLAGRARVSGRDGTIIGIDAAALADGLRRADRPAGLALPTHGAAVTRFSSLGGTFEIANGIARSDDIRLAGDSLQGRGTALLDLPDWRMTARAELALGAPPSASQGASGDMPPPTLVATLDGPIDAPRAALDLAGLKSLLGQRAPTEPARN